MIGHSFKHFQGHSTRGKFSNSSLVHTDQEPLSYPRCGTPFGVLIRAKIFINVQGKVDFLQFSEMSFTRLWHKSFLAS